MNAIEINNLSFSYKDKQIFNKFNLNIEKGKWTCISGTNGSGKSTLIKLIAGILSSDNIKVLNKNDISDIRKNIGVVLDINNYFLCETVIEELAFSLENLNISKNEMNKRIASITKKFKIENLLNKNPNELSGGEKCKVAIMCALISSPKILILDEALSMIDKNEKKEILNMLKHLNEKGLTILMITHDLSETYYSDRLIILSNGNIILDGKPLKVMEYDKVLSRLGISLPFEVELSMKLKLYGLLSDIKTDIDEIVGELWD